MGHDYPSHPATAPGMRYGVEPMARTPHARHVPPVPVASAPGRADGVDALRGLAVVWMTLYHFAFDLNHFGHIRQNFYADPVWTVQRTAIVSLFLFTAGVSQALAVAGGQDWPRFWRRWREVALCALLVSLASWWMFPRSFIHFGVLHGLAVLLVLTRFMALRPGIGDAPLVLTGGLCVGLHHAWFAWAGGWLPVEWVEALNGRILNPLGLVTRKPVTEDYVPLLPWLGVMLWGLAAGRWLLRYRPAWLTASCPVATGPLRVLGRWSLSWYMLHQPVMMGVLMALAAMAHP
jgi:uncharacterized membrane protein